jgi:hypothetical protein
VDVAGNQISFPHSVLFNPRIMPENERSLSIAFRQDMNLPVSQCLQVYTIMIAGDQR